MSSFQLLSRGRPRCFGLLEQTRCPLGHDICGTGALICELRLLIDLVKSTGDLLGRSRYLSLSLALGRCDRCPCGSNLEIDLGEGRFGLAFGLLDDRSRLGLHRGCRGLGV